MAGESQGGRSRPSGPAGGRAAKTLASGQQAPQPGPRNSTKGADRAKLILQVAQQLFRERGYAETSMDDIAQSVGLLKGSLYYYVNSKEDLLYRIIDDVHLQVQARLDAACASTSDSALTRLLTFVRAQVEYNARNVAQISIYHHEWLRLEGGRLEEIRRRRNQQERAVIELLVEARSHSEVPPDLDPKLAASTVFAVTIWPYTWYRPGTVSPARLAAFCADFIRNGLVGGARTE